jgi:hypothetical protein
MTVTAREFVRIWQTSYGLLEVSRKTRSTKNACRIRARRYRLLGVPLKEQSDIPDWDELKQYAESFQKKAR